jgi:hypothetical protein
MSLPMIILVLNGGKNPGRLTARGKALLCNLREKGIRNKGSRGRRVKVIGLASPFVGKKEGMYYNQYKTPACYQHQGNGQPAKAADI